MLDIKATLTRVRRRIEKPETFCRKAFARDAKGVKVNATDAKACRWNIKGAIRREVGAYTPEGVDVETYLTERLDRDDPYYGLSHFNDESTHADVISFLDKAIADAPMSKVAMALGVIIAMDVIPIERFAEIGHA